MSDQVVEYKVIQEDGIETLTKIVNDLIERGWRPHGSLVVIPKLPSGTALMYCQAMVL